MADGVESICKYDPLFSVSSCAGLIRWEEAYPVSKSDLKYWAIFLCQLPGYFRMAATKLQQVSKEWDTGYLRKALHLRGICSIQISDEEEDDRDDGDAGSLKRHGCNGDDTRRSLRLKEREAT